MNLNLFSLFLAVSSVIQISTLKKKMKLVTIDWCNLQDSDGEKLRKESNIYITIIMSIMIIIAVFVLCLFYVSGPFFCVNIQPVVVASPLLFLRTMKGQSAMSEDRS